MTRRQGAIAIVVASLALFGASGAVSDYASSWYRALRRPTWLTFERRIPFVWAFIYACTTISALLTLRDVRSAATRRAIFGLLGANALLHFTYSILFTRARSILGAAIDSHFIVATIGTVMALQWSHSRAAALLNVPYLAWTTFATYLTWTLYSLNREEGRGRWPDLSAIANVFRREQVGAPR